MSLCSSSPPSTSASSGSPFTLTAAAGAEASRGGKGFHTQTTPTRCVLDRTPFKGVRMDPIYLALLVLIVVAIVVLIRR